MTKCAAVILAGGLSSRMGQDKAYLKIDNRTLVEFMEDLLREAGLSTVYISNKDFIPDIIPNCGPLGGVHSILSHDRSRSDHLIFVPVDMPGLSSNILKGLKTAPKNTDLVHFRSYKMPFRLSSKLKWKKLAHSLLTEKKDISLGHFQNQIAEKLILERPARDEIAFMNINNPHDWQSFQQMEKK